jgi:hypothetical protein
MLQSEELQKGRFYIWGSVLFVILLFQELEGRNKNGTQKKTS